MFPVASLEQSDPEIWNSIGREARRQEEHIELIASENYASPAVLAAQGSPLTGENAAARIAQLNILDALFVVVAQRDYAQAERQLGRTMLAVAHKRK